MSKRPDGKTKAWRRPEVQRATCLPVISYRLQQEIENTTGYGDTRRGIDGLRFPSRWGRWCKALRAFAKGVGR